MSDGELADRNAQGAKTSGSVELNIEAFTKGGLAAVADAYRRISGYEEALAKVSDEFVNLSPEEVDKSDVMKAVLRSLVNKGIIKEYDTGVQFSQLDLEKINELSKTSLELSIDDNTGIAYYISKEGERIELNFDFPDDIMHRKTIEALLPDVTFDVLQNGNVTRAKEAEAVYKVITLNKIYKGIYSDEIYTILDGYDFKILRNENKERSFVNLLKVILEEAPSVTRILSSAMNLKLSKIKTKKELKLQNSISDLEDAELKDLKLKILVLRNQYAEKIANETTKARREVKREELVAEERKLIESSNVQVLYDIFNSSTEAIPVMPRIEIARAAKYMAYAIKDKLELENDDPFVRKLMTKFQRRGFSEYMSEYKKNLLEDYYAGRQVNIHPKE